MLQNEVERPCQGGSSRLMPSDEQGDHLVSQFDVTHRLACLVARFDEHCQYVLTSGAASRPASYNLSEQDLVYLVHELHHAPPPCKGAEDALQPGDQR